MFGIKENIEVITIKDLRSLESAIERAELNLRYSARQLQEYTDEVPRLQANVISLKAELEHKIKLFKEQ